MKLCFNLTGNHCNEYPCLTIYYNKDNIFCDYIYNQTVLEFDVDFSDIGIITLSGIQKSNGLNDKWDTVLDNTGQIVKDKNLQINNISVDNIDMGTPWINRLPMCKENNETISCQSGMWDNGSIQFAIKAPVLNWIIEEKFINPVIQHQSPIKNFSGQDKFDYEYIRHKIKSIKSIIHDQKSNL
jgi:hypothetical protein